MRPTFRSIAVAVLLASAAMPGHGQDTGIPDTVLQSPPAALAQPGSQPVVSVQLPKGTPAELTAPGAPPPIAKFTDALTQAYWAHPALLADRANLRGANYRLAHARAAFGPQITAEASYGFRRDNIEAQAGNWFAREGWSSAAAAILSQPLFTFGRNAATEQEAQATIAYRRSALRAREIEVLFNSIRAYAAVLRDRAAVEIVTDDLALLEREYADNRFRFDKREVTSTDVQQVETRLEQARAQVLAARANLATSEAYFVSAIGAPPAADLAPPNPLSIPVRSLEDAQTQADTNSPLLDAAYARERISRARRNGARAARLPRVDLRGRADYGAVSPYNDSLRKTGLSGEVVVSMPLLESGAGRAEIGEADAANDADWRLIDSALRESRAEVAGAWNEWVAQSASIERLRLATSAARAALDGALLQERAGMRTTLDVLQLARELLVVRSTYNAATANAYVAQARLLAAIGALEYTWLIPEAPGFDAGADYRKATGSVGVPLIGPVLRAIDRVPAGSTRDRPIRDGAALVAAPPAAIAPPPADAPAGNAKTDPQ
ncbi:MAG: TolC family protein [Novosphingobium sp.]